MLSIISQVYSFTHAGNKSNKLLVIYVYSLVSAEILRLVVVVVVFLFP